MAPTYLHRSSLKLILTEIIFIIFMATLEYKNSNQSVYQQIFYPRAATDILFRYKS